MARHELVRASRLQSGDVITMFSCATGLLGAWAVLYFSYDVLPQQIKNLYVRDGVLTTLLEVVPAVIVAVAIFAAGTIFVIAQLIGTTLGSRAVLSLLTSTAARAGVIAGMMLLLASLAAATVSNVPGGPEEWRATPAGASTWRLVPTGSDLSVELRSFAVALSLVTGVYVLGAMRILVGVVWTFVDPDAYSSSLSERRIRGKGRDASDDLYERVRALRQWLRTATASGESRDLAFAQVGLEKLLGTYRRQVAEEKRRRTPGHQRVRLVAPTEFTTSRLRSKELEGATTDVRGLQASQQMILRGWFGDQVGRAVVRGLEVGIRQQTLLRRDADRLVNALCLMVQVTSKETRYDDGATVPVLPEEAGFMLDRIAEIGMLKLQLSTDPVWSDWFEFPAVALARVERKLEGVPVGCRDPWLEPEPWASEGAVETEEHKYRRIDKYSLAERALAAWALVQWALEQGSAATTFAGQDELGPRATGSASGDMWSRAAKLASSPHMQPSWSPSLYTVSDEAQHQPPIPGLESYVCALRQRVLDARRANP